MNKIRKTVSVAITCILLWICVSAMGHICRPVNTDITINAINTFHDMPEDTFENIIKKYVEMNIAHPFMEGNGRSTRIWLDLLLKNRLSKCVDWSRIEKNDYMNAMRVSPINPKPIYILLSDALTDKINDKELFNRGIDCSYYYEEEE